MAATLGPGSHVGFSWVPPSFWFLWSKFRCDIQSAEEMQSLLGSEGTREGVVSWTSEENTLIRKRVCLFVCMGVLPACVTVHDVHTMAEETERDGCISRNWNYSC